MSPLRLCSRTDSTRALIDPFRIGDTASIGGAGLKGIAASAEFVLILEFPGEDAVFDAEQADVASVAGDEGFEHGVLFEVARRVETAPLAVEPVEDFVVVDGEPDRGSGGIHAMLEGIVPDGVLALLRFGAGALLGVSPIGRDFAGRQRFAHDGPG
jgi:hypothetical protein